MRVIFLGPALRELHDAINYYELQVQGLGSRFKTEIDLARKRIAAYPFAWPIEKADVRKCLLHKFPYKILYIVQDDQITVLAVAHQHREPDYWVRRRDLTE
jgi:mRNA-degrading endonuclease RelE of RelBE toxin-antitoxin system